QRAPVVTAAMSALADQGEAALPALSQALANEKTRYWALLVVSDLGPSAKAALPTLTALLPKANVLDQREILMALAKIGPPAAEAAPGIAAALKSDDQGVRYSATYAAGSVGASDAAVLAALNENVKSDDAILKMTSAWALAKLQPTNPLASLTAVRELAAGMTSDDATVRQMASLCLSSLKLGPAQATQLLPQIMKVFGSDDPQRQLSAVDALEGLLAGADPSPLLATLLQAEATRPLGAAAAARIGAPAKGATAALAEALTDARPAVRRDTAVALASIGPDAAAAVDALQNTLASDEDSDVQSAAAYALGRIGPAAQSAAQALTDALGDSSTAAIAAWALANVAPSEAAVAQAAVPQLIKNLELNHATEREQAAHALALFGARAADARDALQYASEDPDRNVRAAATAALKAIAGE
ncbi:MAG: HEAT repeat domain-containing protein, partial [Planctomycetales bacterium]|nr:HEAT repeat domain-containing protein [Planctomycetales bacterium]